MKTRWVIPAAVLLGPVLLSGCAAASSSGTSQVEVVTAFYPLEFVAQRVAGEQADVTGLTTPGQEPHDLELSVAGNAALSGADLVVYEAGFQAAVDSAVAQNATGTALDATDVVTLMASSEEEHGEQQEGAGHEDEVGGLDPHFWLDPLLLADVADAVAGDLADVDPDHAEGYTANAASLRRDLEQVDGAYTARLQQCDRSVVVVSHDAFGYLDRYGLSFAAVAGLSPDAEPTPADVARLQALIEREGVTTVFSETLASPRLTASLARDAGVATQILDPIEGLTDQTSEENYLSLMRSNLSALEKANGCR